MKKFDHKKFLKWCWHHPLITSAVVLLVLALISFLLIDKPLMQFMDSYSPDHPVYNRFDFYEQPTINALRQFGKVWVPLWLLLMWAFLTPWRKAATAGLLAMVLIMPFVFGTKYAVGRLRPEKQLIQLHQPEETNRIHSGSPSFPSGDAATVFAVAAAVAAFSPLAVSIPAYLIAAAVGVLRVVSLDHFFSDVFVGAAIGLFAGFWAARIIENSPHTRIKPPEQLIWKIITYVLIVGMPLWASFFGDSNPLIIFLKIFWPHVLLFFLTVLTLGRYIPAETQGIESEQKNEE